METCCVVGLLTMNWRIILALAALASPVAGHAQQNPNPTFLGLTVTGASALNNLTVTGTTNLSAIGTIGSATIGNLNVTGTGAISSLAVTGAATLGSLTVPGAATFGDVDRRRLLGATALPSGVFDARNSVDGTVYLDSVLSTRDGTYPGSVSFADKRRPAFRWPLHGNYPAVRRSCRTRSKRTDIDGEYEWDTAQVDLR